MWEDELGLFEPKLGVLVRGKLKGQGLKRCDEGNRGWSDEWFKKTMTHEHIIIMYLLWIPAQAHQISQMLSNCIILKEKYLVYVLIIL